MHYKDRILSSINGVGKNEYSHAKKIKLGLYLIPETKISSKFKDSNIIFETVKFLEENIGENHGICHGIVLPMISWIFMISPKSQKIKAKIDEWDCVKLIGFYSERK